MNKVNADQIVWLEDAINRFGSATRSAIGYPPISRITAACRMALILEIMEILGLELQEGSGARHNLLRHFDIRREEQSS